MSKTHEEQVIFCVSPEGQGDGMPVLLLGVSTAAWEYMKDGMAHTLDLTSIGLPIKLLIYGAKDHDAVMKVIEEHNAKRGIATLDERRTDFSMKSPT